MYDIDDPGPDVDDRPEPCDRCGLYAGCECYGGDDPEADAIEERRRVSRYVLGLLDEVGPFRSGPNWTRMLRSVR